MNSTNFARNLRKKQTPAEAIFWSMVRNRRFHNMKFIRQKVFKFQYFNKNRFFIADFYCAKAKLIIEIDGLIHEKQKQYDSFRTEILEKLGYTVIRFQNEDVFNNIEAVNKALFQKIDSP